MLEIKGEGNEEEKKNETAKIRPCHDHFYTRKGKKEE